MNKFLNLYEAITQLVTKVDQLDQRSIGKSLKIYYKNFLDGVGQKSIDFSNELDIIISRLYNMKEVDYDKNKIDYLVIANPI